MEIWREGEERGLVIANAPKDECREIIQIKFQFFLVFLHRVKENA